MTPPKDAQWTSSVSNMCEACARRACGSCSLSGCECFFAYSAWQSYHAATIRPISKGRDHWSPESSQRPPHSAYSGRHERNLAFSLGNDGRRQRSSPNTP